MEFMSDPYFYERLQSIECDSMNGETAELLAPYFRYLKYVPKRIFRNVCALIHHIVGLYLG
jgi:hypothetical protein